MLVAHTMVSAVFCFVICFVSCSMQRTSGVEPLSTRRFAASEARPSREGCVFFVVLVGSASTGDVARWLVGRIAIAIQVKPPAFLTYSIKKVPVGAIASDEA